MGKTPSQKIHSTKCIVRSMLPFWSTAIAKRQCWEECPCLTPHITSPGQPVPLVLYLLSPGVCSYGPLCPDTLQSHFLISTQMSPFLGGCPPAFLGSLQSLTLRFPKHPSCCKSLHSIFHLVAVSLSSISRTKLAKGERHLCVSTSCSSPGVCFVS